VNAALWRLQDSGEYTKIYARWLDQNAEPTVAPSSMRAFDTTIIARTWSFFVRGVWMTAVMALASFLFGLPLGLCVALARMQPNRLVTTSAAIYVEVMRGTPLLVQILFVYFVLPGVGINLSAYTSGILALTLNAAAYISEVIRAGIVSIDAGQMEAARALGMSHWQAMHRIILPQTFRRVVPPLTNEGISLLKDSSLVSVIGLTELARTGQELASRYASPLTVWPLVALLYLALTFPLTRMAESLERRWRPVTRA
jgi:His/Glu/Gln/Arg/opine family amino acid ABC transporter permease subunit